MSTDRRSVDKTGPATIRQQTNQPKNKQLHKKQFLKNCEGCDKEIDKNRWTEGHQQENIILQQRYQSGNPKAQTSTSQDPIYTGAHAATPNTISQQ